MIASAGVFDEAAEPLVMRRVAALASDSQIAAFTVVRIVHCVDGGWSIGGHAFTNDEIDEGPE